MLAPTIYAPLLLAALASAPPAPARSVARVQSSPDSLGHFPRVTGQSLAGARLELPRDLGGELNVVVVAFAREQQRDVDGWTPFLSYLEDTRRDVRVYELPTLARRYRPMRSFIDGGMRRGIPDPAVRAATVTLYVDKAPFRRALRLGGEDRIHVLLVDREGRVHWRAEGAYDAARGAELARRLDELRPRPTDDGEPRYGLASAGVTDDAGDRRTMPLRRAGR